MRSKAEIFVDIITVGKGVGAYYGNNPASSALWKRALEAVGHYAAAGTGKHVLRCHVNSYNHGRMFDDNSSFNADADGTGYRVTGIVNSSTCLFNVCRCDIKDLLSDTGHASTCPERKKR